jgi:hypothetical protein
VPLGREDGKLTGALDGLQAESADMQGKQIDAKEVSECTMRGFSSIA